MRRRAWPRPTARPVPRRPPGSILGALLDRDGPGSLGDHLGQFADAAIVDSRVLLAHRVGAEEAGWPAAEDRFASDLLLAERIADPWLRELTASAAAAPIPVLLGGHTLVGPGVRLVIGGTPRARAVEVTPGIRRDPVPDLDAVGQDEDLVARIHEEIARDGPITFARFMDLALYDPDGGYYRAEAARPGRDGDFLTAPEAHPIFGAALARAVADAWDRLGRPEPFVLREYGAGTGTLAVAILDGLTAEHPDLAARLRYDPIEIEPRRHAAIATRLEAAGHGDALIASDRSGAPVDRFRPRQRGPRRAPGPPRRGPRRQPARGPRRVARRRVRRRRGRADDARPRGTARRRVDRARRGPARGDLPGDRSVARGRGGRPRARRAPPHRLRLPRRRALRPDPAPRRHAPCLPAPSRPRRPVHPRRAPGPDRPCRRHARWNAQRPRPA